MSKPALKLAPAATDPAREALALAIEKHVAAQHALSEAQDRHNAAMIRVYDQHGVISTAEAAVHRAKAYVAGVFGPADEPEPLSVARAEHEHQEAQATLSLLRGDGDVTAGALKRAERVAHEAERDRDERLRETVEGSAALANLVARQRALEIELAGVRAVRHALTSVHVDWARHAYPTSNSEADASPLLAQQWGAALAALRVDASAPFPEI